MEDYILVFTAVLLCFWYWKQSKSSQNVPPGPTGLPYIGYLPFIKTKQNLTYASLKKKYGDIFSVKFGGRLVVLLSSYETVKEAFVKQSEIFSNRPLIMTASPPEFTEATGVSFTNDKPWIDNRRLTFTHIKMFTRSTGIGESVIIDEIQFLLRAVKSNDGKPAIFNDVIFKSITNVIWAFIFGKRKDYDDEEYVRMLNATHVYMRSLKFAGGDLAFPRIFRLKLVQDLLGMTTGYKAFRQIHKYFGEQIDQIYDQMPKGDSDNNKYNFVQEWFKVHPKNSPKFDYYRDQLIGVMKDLFVAGSDTTSLTIQWALMYMIEYPKIQRKVQDEIDNVIGKNDPSMSDKTQMPYTEATIMEISRIVSVGPIGGIRTNFQTTTINGYTIPKDSIVLPNLWAIHHDPKVFPNPDEFRPERFLENGQLKKADELTPFGLGGRQCAGELLARLELFLYFTSLLQHFKFKKAEGATISFDYEFAAVLTPRSQEMCAIPRI